MSKLISRLAFVIVVNCYLGLAATADSSPSLIANKNFGQLNGAHLKFAVAHVNERSFFLIFYFYTIAFW
jgi:hypothetical protein